MWKIVSASVVAVAVAGLLVSGSISANDLPVADLQVPNPCDFITGGGFIISTITLEKANFGAHGGCKHGSFWGHVNYIDHGGFNGKDPYHVQSEEITGYFMDLPNARTICGFAKTNAGERVGFRVRMQDNEAPVPDFFEIELTNLYAMAGPLTGGHIELHKANRSTKPPILEPDQLICPPPVPGGGPGPD